MVYHRTKHSFCHLSNILTHFIYTYADEAKDCDVKSQTSSRHGVEDEIENENEMKMEMSHKKCCYAVKELSLYGFGHPHAMRCSVLQCNPTR